MSLIATLANLLAPGWVGSIIGIVGLLAAIAIYFKTRQRTGISFAWRSERLIGAHKDALPDEITISYRGNPVPRVTKSLLVFWNSGDRTLSGQDIAPADPLRLAIASDGSILSINVIHTSRQVNAISIAKSNDDTSQACLAFDFLDASDGAVIEILHTSDDLTIKFIGTVRGVPKGIKDAGPIARSPGLMIPLMNRRLPYQAKLVGWIALLAGGASALIGLLAPINEILLFQQSNSVSAASALIASGLLYFFTGLAMLFLLRRKHPRKLHVDEFE